MSDSTDDLVALAGGLFTRDRLSPDPDPLVRAVTDFYRHPRPAAEPMDLGREFAPNYVARMPRAEREALLFRLRDIQAEHEENRRRSVDIAASLSERLAGYADPAPALGEPGPAAADAETVRLTRAEYERLVGRHARQTKQKRDREVDEAARQHGLNGVQERQRVRDEEKREIRRAVKSIAAKLCGPDSLPVGVSVWSADLAVHHLQRHWPADLKLRGAVTMGKYLREAIADGDVPPLEDWTI